jgi:hypothetical protein
MAASPRSAAHSCAAQRPSPELARRGAQAPHRTWHSATLASRSTTFFVVGFAGHCSAQPGRSAAREGRCARVTSRRSGAALQLPAMRACVAAHAVWGETAGPPPGEGNPAVSVRFVYEGAWPLSGTVRVRRQRVTAARHRRSAFEHCTHTSPPSVAWATITRGECGKGSFCSVSPRRVGFVFCAKCAPLTKGARI